ncbi:MAG TPA: zinc ribbon domain-containing protein [bacterium]|nr:zinc ribbon domain-containing protein [bacterium]HQO36239.1 zinc ribbon domain-containing protein [bacterium]HQQ00748.1 zinc ribbon domain-containing protein [bacterium]
MDVSAVKEQWTCPKCRSRGCMTQEMSLTKASDKLVLRAGSEKYLALTCTLCGYSELYNMKVLARIAEEVPIENAAPIAKQVDLIKGDQ